MDIHTGNRQRAGNNVIASVSFTSLVFFFGRDELIEDIKEVLKRLVPTGASSSARLRQNTEILGGEQS